MQKTRFHFGALIFSLLLIAGAAQAQYLVSSKAGLVNRVEGKVQLKAQGSALGEMSTVSMGQQMKEGDRLSTSANSYAELLLSPGSYLRLNEKTEIEAVRTPFDNTRFDVLQGSVILEVGEIDKKTPFEIGTPRTVVTINKVGIYRIDVIGQDVAVSVRKGEAYLGTREQLFAHSAIKVGGNKAYRFIGDGPPQTAKLNSKVYDAFDQWSYLQAESLVAANYGVLQRTRSRSSLLSGWVYDPYLNRYTYIPGSWLFVSPYGFGFYRRYGDCDWCWSGFSYPYYGGGTTIAGGGGGNQPSAPPRVTNDDRVGSRVQTQRDVQSRQVQPYSRPEVFYPVDRSSRYGGSGDSGSIFNSSRSTSSPSYSSPSSSMPSAPSRVEPSSGGGDRGGGGRGDTSRPTGNRGN
jgi:hypothetical protein